MSKATQILLAPQKGPQTWLLTCPVGDILFGGARGGGKTLASLLDWLSHQTRYGKDARGVWFRRTLPEIEGASVPMAQYFPQLGAVYQVQARTWTFPSGATLKLRYLESDQDADRYQGHEYTWLCFDEVGTWSTSRPIDKLRATLRSAAGVPVRLVATANPGGPGHAWIKARYVTPADPLTPFVGDDGQRRVFIPSRISDNPALLKADPTYIDRLKASGPPWLVRAWLDGDWDATLQGEMIRAEWLQHSYATAPARTGRTLISVDTAIKAGRDNDYTAMIVAVEDAGRLHIIEIARGKWEFPDLRLRLAALCELHQPHVVLIEDKGSGQSLLQQLRADGFRWPLVPCVPTADKVTRLWTETGRLEAGGVLLPESAPWLRDFIDECLTFPKGAHDDQVDALSQLLRYVREGVDLWAVYGA